MTASPEAGNMTGLPENQGGTGTCDLGMGGLLQPSLKLERPLAPFDAA